MSAAEKGGLLVIPRIIKIRFGLGYGGKIAHFKHPHVKCSQPHEECVASA